MPPTRTSCVFLISGEAVASMLHCSRTRGNVRVWQVSGRPRANHGAESPSVIPTAQGYRVWDSAVYELLNCEITGFGYSVDACMEVAIVALNASRKLATINCPSCATLHLDMHSHALELHHVHCCTKCGHRWE